MNKYKTTVHMTDKNCLLKTYRNIPWLAFLSVSFDEKQNGFAPFPGVSERSIDQKYVTCVILLN